MSAKPPALRSWGKKVWDLKHFLEELTETIADMAYTINHTADYLTAEAFHAIYPPEDKEQHNNNRISLLLALSQCATITEQRGECLLKRINPSIKRTNPNTKRK